MNRSPLTLSLQRLSTEADELPRPLAGGVGRRLMTVRVGRTLAYAHDRCRSRVPCRLGSKRERRLATLLERLLRTRSSAG